ncbi:MAG: CBS domain-containing protein [Clostridiales bacterium]|nr:CBS domain-containing protein [Clostridiales bacterium]
MNKNIFIPVTTNASISEFASEIISIIRSNLTPGKLREAIGEYHEKDIAATLTSLTKEECQRLFRIMQPENIANVLEYAEHNDSYFELLGINQKTEVLFFMETSSAVELLQNLSKENRTTLLDLMRPDIRAEIKLISSFDEDEIGSKMSTNFIAVSNNSTVKVAMSELICQAAENDNISTLYVVDENKTFCGAIDLKDLIIARENTPLSDITTLSYPYLYAKMEIQDCIPFLRDYSENSIPVLDDENKLLGIVTSHDFIEILGEELNEDYVKLGGLPSEEDLAEPIF